MVNMENRKGRGRDSEELIRCASCDDYIRNSEGFYCPTCKKGPLCKKHRLPRHRECLGCTFDLKLKEVAILKQQENNIKSFVNFIYFLFLIFAVFFAATKFGLTKEIELLQNHLITESLIYIGIGSAILYGIFYILLMSQRNRIGSVESEIRDIEIER